MKIVYLLLIVLCLSACQSSPKSELSKLEETKQKSTKPAPSQKVIAKTKVEQAPIQQSADMPEMSDKQKVYYLQHRVIPAWTFEYQEMFLADLIKGDLSKLKSVTADIISQEYAQQINSIPVDLNSEDEDALAAVIVFPVPKYAPNCFFVMIKKERGQFSYHTYEKTPSLLSDVDTVVGVMGGWDADGNHLNFGPRAYDDIDSFIEELNP